MRLRGLDDFELGEIALVEIPTGEWSWIDAAAERFGGAWKKGLRPRIEDFLVDVPEPRWRPLLSGLLRVERELRGYWRGADR